MKVSVFMGSDSDWEVMQHCIRQLKQLGIDTDVQIQSAHRDPDGLRTAILEAEKQGTELFIAAAGMSAALSGVIASHSLMPVLGVPLSGGATEGLDALLSTVQMPAGVPVGCTAIGKAGAINAALLAARILSLKYPELNAPLHEHRAVQQKKVREKNEQLCSRIQNAAS